MATELAYFPVDAKFPATQAARMVCRRFGEEGLAAYVRLLCAMVGEESGRLRAGVEEEWEDIADLAHLGSVEDARALVAILARYGAVENRDGYVSAQIVTDALEARDRAAQQKVAAGKASGEARRRRKAEKKAAANTNEQR